MKQCEPCIQNNNNNNKTSKKKKSNGGGASQREGVEIEGEKILFFIFSVFVSFSDLRKSDRRFLSGLKAKLIYATRATRGHQNLGVSSNFTR